MYMLPVSLLHVTITRVNIHVTSIPITCDNNTGEYTCYQYPYYM